MSTPSSSGFWGLSQGFWGITGVPSRPRFNQMEDYLGLEWPSEGTQIISVEPSSAWFPDPSFYNPIDIEVTFANLPPINSYWEFWNLDWMEGPSYDSYQGFTPQIIERTDTGFTATINPSMGWSSSGQWRLGLRCYLGLQRTLERIRWQIWGGPWLGDDYLWAPDSALFTLKSPWTIEPTSGGPGTQITYTLTEPHVPWTEFPSQSDLEGFSMHGIQPNSESSVAVYANLISVDEPSFVLEISPTTPGAPGRVFRCYPQIGSGYIPNNFKLIMPPPPFNVDSISPTTATRGTPTKFVITGTGLDAVQWAGQSFGNFWDANTQGAGSDAQTDTEIVTGNVSFSTSLPARPWYLKLLDENNKWWDFTDITVEVT